MSREHAHQWVDPTTWAGINRPPTVRSLTVIEVTFRRGEGCCLTDLVREVVAFFDMDGNFLAERDPFVAPVTSFCATVRDAGGGVVELLVDRDTESYPSLGEHVTVTQR